MELKLRHVVYLPKEMLPAPCTTEDLSGHSIGESFPDSKLPLRTDVVQPKQCLIGAIRLVETLVVHQLVQKGRAVSTSC